MDIIKLKTIATIRTDFPEKFGIPRQSGISELTGYIIFEPEFRNESSLRGLDGFSHLWIIWGFSLGFASSSGKSKWSPTVRPPRLGGNTRMGVFATRSPNRPNPIGLSCVKIIRIENSADFGPVIVVSGIDMADMTPIYDIKPYLPAADSVPDASGGFAADIEGKKLDVFLPDNINEIFPTDKIPALIRILEEDPRPSYQDDAERSYGLSFAGYNIDFKVSGNDLTVTSLRKL